ncbi:MAG: tRNA (adenosine(37)-N6)-threonylcarbamoyltransferase complex ATPase subunit type 1 TsaE, partial [Chitinophagia bacterium]|nr:tRNA (adenosine(37)-N6)-threonylcarbamoyltransferase complex ATPase subunit type 1 TsaE [Chitinophagia bacterium]
VLQLGLDELIEEPNYFFIEWAEIIAFILPKDVIWVYIRVTENSTTREISFEL